MGGGVGGRGGGVVWVLDGCVRAFLGGPCFDTAPSIKDPRVVRELS